VIFMRLLALIWIAQGLAQWSAVLLPSQPLFDKVSQVWGGAVIFFAVLDPVAAVGLWLATPWGGVLWLFSAIAQIFVAAAIPDFFSMTWIAANIFLIVIYFGLTWRAGRLDPASGAPR
jgi:nicotinamide riboside transporter PnuC